MENQISTKRARRYYQYTGAIDSNYIHLRNPWIVAWWSAAFPGFGHLKLGIYIKGFILMFWEIIINVHSRINEAMVYSFNGDFELAKEVLNTRMLLLYIAIYIITIWDSYRLCVDINKQYLLAEFEDALIVPFTMTGYSINFLDKRSPWLAIIISMLFPGLGHLYLHRIPTGFILMTFTIVIIYMSNFLDGMHHSILGSFVEANTEVDPEWALFLPSIYVFALYESYVICVENNKVFKKEQVQFLKKDYQHDEYPLLQTKGGAENI